MTSARGQRVYALFEAALNCDPPGRRALIKELSGDDPQRSAEVERLLAQDAEAERDRFLATPAPTERDAERQDRSNDGNSGFSWSQSLEETSAETPIPATTLPPGLADHPDYEIMRELGRGGMGVVYLAQNKLMGRDEVLKVMGRQIIERPGVLDRFLREIRSAAKLHHPNIVTAYSAIRLGESIVFAMEYVDGLRPGQDGQGQGAAAGGPRLQLHLPGGAGLAARPRAGHGPPRHQAGQPDARPPGRTRRRSRCSTSAWPRSTQRGARRQRPDPRGPDAGHARLHRPRADPRRPVGRHPGRHLQPRLSPSITS